jgi:hypothetical protein
MEDPITGGPDRLDDPRMVVPDRAADLAAREVEHAVAITI